MINYRAKQEREANRKVLFNTALEKFNKGEIQPVRRFTPASTEAIESRKRNAENGILSQDMKCQLSSSVMKSKLLP